MPSISKQLLKSVDKYYAEIPHHPLNQLGTFSPEKKYLILQRVYYHLANGVPGFSHLYRRAAELAPTPEAKAYMMNIYDKLQQAYPSLIADFKHFTENPTCDPVYHFIQQLEPKS